MSPSRRPGPPRLVDVADRAGVSMKTVSNVVNDPERVAPRTRERVLAAIEEVGYRPNLSARNLARGRSGILALVVPDLEMPFFASLAGEVVREAEARGSFVLLHQTGGDLEAERRALEGRFTQRVDGLLVSSHGLTRHDLRSRPGRTPVVVLSNRDDDPETPHVGIDNRGAALEAVRHLVGRGRRRLAMIGASGLGAPAPRTRGYLDGLEDAGLPLDRSLVRGVGANTGDEGERVTTELLAAVDTPPDGILAITDWVGMGVMRALHHHGLRIPADVAVVGFDDIPYARSFYPSLTTIAPDRSRTVALALDLLEREIRGDGTGGPPSDHRVPHRLLVRESTAD